MTAAVLWTAVKASYEVNGLLNLTNIRNRSAIAIDDAVGEDAAQGVIDLWPLYAQEAYDSADTQHVEVAKQGVIALLWRRGGTASTIEEVKWETVFSPDGLVAKVKRTGPRSRQGPSSNSGTQQKVETVNGQRIRPWASKEALPINFLSRDALSSGD